MFRSQKGDGAIILVFAIFVGIFLAGLFNVVDTNNPVIGILQNAQGKVVPKNSLQLNPLDIISATPTPIPTNPPNVSPSSGPNPTTPVGGTPPPTSGSLLCGTNLGLFDDNDWINDPGAQAALAKLHVSTLRMPLRTDKDPTGSRLVHSVQITHSLGVIPLIILPSETTYINLDKSVISQINTIMGGSQVFYELGNEVFDSAYLGKWNTIIPVLKPLAVNAWFGGPAAILNAGVTATTNMAQFYVQAKPTPDFLSWHEYTCGHTDNTQYCYDHIANAPGHNWSQHIQDTQAALQKLGVTTMPKIFITEWNYDSVDPGSNDQRLAQLNAMHFTTAALNELKSIGVYAAYHYSWNTGQAYPLVNYNGSTITGQGQDFQSTCAGM